MSKKKEKTFLKLSNKVYDYSQLFDSPLKPRGEGARYDAGKEVHDAVKKMFDYAIENDLLVYLIAYSRELIERMILDKIDMSLEEVAIADELGIE